ncbi:Putative TrmH family tRNA/rRNA methyltransferase [Rubrobacter xylanophilus DSM 9941]|uniref:23S rRNA (guanosine(2251)-2'-O)-methyltransferase RlmB n=1 Tax=Rubrobacter xylanophilus TaxID=49319 RepID=UPI001C641AEE|nr:23S rRNA (guanosine(2251)-2'-O)-methyltransferase RlmB [Rubrobacter xylanophilus]QYJ15331.1 Putative TrmH family tRNA/rRNA methyltransferase [Rubrobacter xylanophilus DSM 9941]
MDVIYGVRPVVEALRGRRTVHEILDATGNWEVERLAKERGVALRRVPRDRVARLAGGVAHQGVAARAEPYPYAALEEVLAEGDAMVAVLDGITDPRNLGAVLRVADGAGASGVVIPKDRAAGVTPAAVKASAGASEHVRVARVTNLRRAIERMKEAGVWVYAAEPCGETYTEVDLSGRVAVVLGSEGRGMRRLVREGCDGVLSIPMLGAVSSLNVSVAAAVLLYEARRQRGWQST